MILLNFIAVNYQSKQLATSISFFPPNKFNSKFITLFVLSDDLTFLLVLYAGIQIVN